MSFEKTTRMSLLGFLILLSGCIQMLGGFENEDVQKPCSIVTWKEIRNVYGYQNITEKEVVTPDYSFCVFSGQEPGHTSMITRDYIILMYVPLAESNDTIRETFLFENQTEKAYILEEDLGIGDKSFLAIHKNTETNKTHHLSLVVFKGPSAIIFTDAGYPVGGVDMRNRKKLETLAGIALDRLIKKG